MHENLEEVSTFVLDSMLWESVLILYIYFNYCSMICIFSVLYFFPLNNLEKYTLEMGSGNKISLCWEHPHVHHLECLLKCENLATPLPVIYREFETCVQGPEICFLNKFSGDSDTYQCSDTAVLGSW